MDRGPVPAGGRAAFSAPGIIPSGHSGPTQHPPTRLPGLRVLGTALAEKGAGTRLPGCCLGQMGTRAQQPTKLGGGPLTSTTSVLTLLGA